MKAAWISLNFIGLLFIVGGAIFAMNHRAGVYIVLIGMLSLGVSNYFRMKYYKKW